MGQQKNAFFLDYKQAFKVAFAAAMIFAGAISLPKTEDGKTGLAVAANTCSPVKTSFIQPWLDTYSSDPIFWNNEMRAHNNMGVKRLVLQWVHWGHSKNERYHAPKWLVAALKAAERTGTKIWLGLRYDPHFIRGINGPDAKNYINQRLVDNFQITASIQRLLYEQEISPTTIAGWYIPDEIDAAMLLSKQTRLRLESYFRITRQMLNSNGDYPVAASGYTNLGERPKEVVHAISQFVANTGIRTVFGQDGVGAGLLQPKQSENLYRKIERRARIERWTFVPVVEIFNVDNASTEFRTLPASAEEVYQRLENQSDNVAVFSMAQHIIHAQGTNRDQLKALFENWSLNCPL
ncbi:DUF4434 domain-containing protein [Polycladidibacter hongkongensis]|uniref:DUF4434 domain-containing protein n=1 Tax=Polycladidibacter hongkongensis TaxID=1647556 RepID=UPI00082E59DA|nr:DUF4434 domain-containing protein [Pseudovibrio hongkongensis]